MPDTPSIQTPVVARIDERTVEISWRFTGEPVTVAVHRGDSPDHIDRRRPLVKPQRNTSARITDLAPDRPHYFEIAPQHGPALITSERRLPLEGAVNFRDMGGYRNRDGLTVKWGRVFRADNLARLTERDLEFISHLGLATVCDFRTDAEINRSPNRYPAGAELKYLHLPIQHGENDPVTAFERIRNGDHEWLSEAFMAKGYVLSVDRFAPLWSTFFRTLAKPERRPLVFHCTGGKDRTGTCAALLLSVLGVPEKTIVEDYTLSAECIAGVLEGIYRQLEELGVEPEKVAPYFTVSAGRMEILLQHLRRTYGSARDYLVNKAGVPGSLLERLKDDLLED